MAIGTEAYPIDFDLSNYLKRLTAQQALGQSPMQTSQPQQPEQAPSGELPGMQISPVPAPSQMQGPSAQSQYQPQYPEQQPYRPPQDDQDRAARDYQAAMRDYEAYRSTGRPNIEEFHPSKTRKVGGVLAGAATAFFTRNPQATMRAYHDVAYAPFDQKEGQYRQRSGELKDVAIAEGKVADFERKAAESKSKEEYYHWHGQAEQARRDAELARQADLNKRSQSRPGSYDEYVKGESTIRSAAIKPEAAPKKQYHWSEDRGTVTVIDPVTGEQVTTKFGDPKKDPEDKRHRNRMDEIRLRESIKPPKEGKENLDKGPSAAAQSTAEKQAIKEIYDQDPEKWKNYIEAGRWYVKKDHPDLPGLITQKKKEILDIMAPKKFDFAAPKTKSGKPRYSIKFEDTAPEPEEDDDEDDK